MLNSNSYFVSILPIATLSTAFLVYAYRTQLSKFVWNCRRKIYVKNSRKVFVISSVNEFEEFKVEFLRNASSINAIGLDCEWVQVKGKRHPVALLQLAFHSGACFLFRLCHTNGCIPQYVKDLLEDTKVIKAGVGVDVDVRYLLSDYGIRVKSWLDLRHLASQASLRSLRPQRGGLGLDALSREYIGKALVKDLSVRIGNWETDILTKEQVEYAAEDALSGVQVLLCLAGILRNIDSWAWPPPFSSQSWESIASHSVESVCRPFVNVTYKQKSQSTTRTGSLPQKQISETTSPYTTRKTPLYYNCQLNAPDGEPLCICDPKKALWYVSKGLGELVSEDPMVVRLKFEPAGRPVKEGIDGQFYLQERLNICVVCGQKDSYIRKNVVPHEYRKYFPKVLKAHQSHDVVLLCVPCHKESNMKDYKMRQILSEEHEAPCGGASQIRVLEDPDLKPVRCAGKALSYASDKIPEERKKTLENVLKEYFDTSILTQEHIEEAANLDVRSPNDNFSPHGHGVYLHYKEIGLVNLEKRWRQWFLDSMEPKFLPDNWSVTHNFEKLKIKMARFPLGDPIREDLRISLVGTKGELDVPYIPKVENGLA